MVDVRLQHRQHPRLQLRRRRLPQPAPADVRADLLSKSKGKWKMLIILRRPDALLARDVWAKFGDSGWSTAPRAGPELTATTACWREREEKTLGVKVLNFLLRNPILRE